MYGSLQLIFLYPGNLHSLKREHHKAIEYFERALRINPYYLSAWTLMGHEFMELKNSNAAIQCYREAVGTLNKCRMPLS